MKYFSVLIKPASSFCNLQCKYCFYRDVSAQRDIKDYGVMSFATTYALITKTFKQFENQVATITFAWQGGEPTCAGIEYFKTFITTVNKHKESNHHINYTIQTNGTLLNDIWARFFYDNNFLVGISLDGYKSNHDYFRANKNKIGSFDTVMNSINILRKYNVDFNILTVLTSKLAKNPQQLFKFYLENSFKYVQLIPCLPFLNDQNSSYALTPELFFEFYDIFFELWFNEYKNNNYISVTLFDNIIPMFVGIPPSQCGYLGVCNIQFVIEGDGSVYPCDFFVLDNYKLGNINLNDFAEMRQAPTTKLFLDETKRTSKLCDDCKFYKICGSQCRRMNVCYFNDDYCGLQNFLSKYELLLFNIARQRY